MNTKIKSLLAAASVLALSAISANAQLQLNHTTATFSNVVGGTFTTTGSGIDSAITFWTPQSPNEVFSVVSTPANIGTNFLLGNPYAVDGWVLNRFGSSFVGIPTSFDFNLALDFGTLGTDLNISLRVTLSQVGTKLHYAFTPLSAASGVVNIDGNFYGYETGTDGTGGDLFASSTSTNGVSGINIVLTAVPEPSTYALFGVVALMGVVAVRRFRSSKSAVVA